ncbi:hypothetical protein J6590_070225 [Homalodisca vitripennis]|nr:hypothetical protein J6590_070225 [Homalodisca vitripennis]
MYHRKRLIPAPTSHTTSVQSKTVFPFSTVKQIYTISLFRYFVNVHDDHNRNSRYCYCPHGSAADEFWQVITSCQVPSEPVRRWNNVDSDLRSRVKEQ